MANIYEWAGAVDLGCPKRELPFFHLTNQASHYLFLCCPDSSIFSLGFRIGAWWQTSDEVCHRFIYELGPLVVPVSDRLLDEIARRRKLTGHSSQEVITECLKESWAEVQEATRNLVRSTEPLRSEETVIPQQEYMTILQDAERTGVMTSPSEVNDEVINSVDGYASRVIIKMPDGRECDVCCYQDPEYSENRIGQFIARTWQTAGYRYGQ